MVIVHPLKEWIGLYLLHTCSTDPVLFLTAEPAHNTSLLNTTHMKPRRNVTITSTEGLKRGVSLPQDQVFGLLWYRHFRRKGQRLSPVHHLPVRLLRRLRAERRVTCTQQKHQPSFRDFIKPVNQVVSISESVTYQHLVHDDTQAPPIAQLVVSILHEDLWSNVVGGSNCGECLRGSGATDSHLKMHLPMSRELLHEHYLTWAIWTGASALLHWWDVGGAQLGTKLCHVTVHQKGCRNIRIEM